ncbi:MAG: hypothetical protein H0W62_15280 [Chitinophagales bacterium]|nr:hypothetical protein [Chitinophagales bacterium]
MKNLLLLILFSLLTFNAVSQIKSSEYGYLFPTEGPFRVLLIYAQVDYSVGGCPSPGDTYECNYGINAEWPKPNVNNCTNALDCAPPTWETANPNPGTHPFFDPDNVTWNDGTLSDYYKQASLNELNPLGDYISISLPCTTPGLGTYPRGAQAVFDYLDAYAPGITTAQGKPLSYFLLPEASLQAEQCVIEEEAAALKYSS